MKLTNCLLMGIVALGIGVAGASADVIVNIATGLDGSGNVQTAGDAVDANWTYSDPAASPATGSAEVVSSGNVDWYGGWLANGPNSSWIAPNPDTTANGPAPYTFSETFDLTGYDLSTVSIVGGGFTIDDAGTLDLNGNILDSLGNGNWGSLSLFTTAVSDFVQGINTLTITMTSDDNYLEGVRVEGTVQGTLASTPEPATWVLFGVGGVAILTMARGRKVSSNA